jgi:hypothetical protein
MKHKASKRFKGHCGMCGVWKNESWDQRRGGTALRQQGARRTRRTRRNTIEAHELD